MKANKKISIVIAIIVVLIAIVLVAFAGGASKNGVAGNANSENATKTAEADKDANGEQFASNEEQGVPIKTNSITFYMPKDLEEVITVETEEKDGIYNAIFSADISGKELELFSIILSKDKQDGYEMGTIKDKENGDIIVTMKMNEQKESDWSKKDFERINELQERVNDFIYQLYEDGRFEPKK